MGERRKEQMMPDGSSLKGCGGWLGCGQRRWSGHGVLETKTMETTFHETNGIAAWMLGWMRTARADYGAGALPRSMMQTAGTATSVTGMAIGMLIPMMMETMPAR